MQQYDNHLRKSKTANKSHMNVDIYDKVSSCIQQQQQTCDLKRKEACFFTFWYFYYAKVQMYTTLACLLHLIYIGQFDLLMLASSIDAPMLFCFSTEQLRCTSQCSQMTVGVQESCSGPVAMAMNNSPSNQPHQLRWRAVL